MKRLFAVALLCSFGDVSLAVAGPTVLESGKQAVRQAARAESLRPVPVRLTVGPRFAQSPGGLASSGMRKRTKLVLGLAVAAAFGGVLYTIDHGVEDSTPSSLGLR